MSTELSVEELALQESMKAVEAEAAAKAEADAKQWGDQSGKAAVTPEPATPDAAAAAPAANPEADAAEVAAEAQAKADAEATEAAKAKAAEHDPHAAIVAFRKQNQALLAEKLRLEGMVQALQTVAQNPAQPQPQVQAEPAVDPLDAIAAKRVALADQADSGDITLAEMRRQDLALERESRDIEFQRFIAQQQAQAVTRPVETDLSLEQATMQLAEDYPVLNELSVTALAPFESLAYAQAEREGKPIQPGALGTLDLRTRMAKLATKMFGAEVATAQPAPKAGVDDGKAAALAAKVELQNTMPPNTHNMGTSNTETSMTEAQLMQRMNDPHLTYEESAKLIASVSPALRQKLGI